MLTNRTFGIEIEGFGISLAQVRDALSNAGLDCQVESYHHCSRGYWKVTTDASVPNGFEVVSPVLSGDAGLEQAKIETVSTMLANLLASYRDCRPSGRGSAMVDDGRLSVIAW